MTKLVPITSPDEIVLKDEALAERISALIEKRLSERPDAVRKDEWGGVHAGTARSVLVSNIDRGAKVVSGPGQYIVRTFANDSEPGYYIVVEGRNVILRGGIRKSDIEKWLQEVAVLPLTPSERVPYGFVNSSGVISAVFWMYDLLRGDTPETENNAYLASECHVLDGEVLPDQIFLDPGTSAGVDWITRFWKLVDEGRMIRLSDRLNNLPREAWAVADGERSWLELEKLDDGLPPFGGCKYRFWHITEKHEGERFADLRRGIEARNPLRGWFK